MDKSEVEGRTITVSRAMNRTRGEGAGDRGDRGHGSRDNYGDRGGAAYERTGFRDRPAAGGHKPVTIGFRVSCNGLPDSFTWRCVGVGGKNGVPCLDT
jgi:hypothetical protein